MMNTRERKRTRAMKRMILLTIVVLTLLSGLAKAEGYAPPEPGAAFTLEGDMGVLVDGVFYKILADFAPLREALGEPVEVASAPSCVFVGEDREFAYDGAYIFTNPAGERDVWYELFITGEGFSTARGLRVGDSFERLRELYGEPHYWEGERMATYSVSGEEGDYESPCMMIELDGEGLVVTIDLYYPTNVS